MNKQIKKKRYWIKVLRKKCPHSQLFWSGFTRIRTEYGEIREYRQFSRSEDEKLLKEITMKNEKFQKVDIRRSLNKKGQKEKGKCEVSRKQKYDNKENGENVLARRHSKMGEILKKIKRPINKDEKVAARFSLDLDKIRA